MNESKILITGGSGLIGKHLQKYIPNAIFLSSKECDLMDLQQIDDIMKKYNPNVVIHLAAKVGGIMEHIKYPLDYIEENLLINTNLLKKCHEHNVDRVIAILSTCIYPDFVEHYPINENQLFNGPPAPGNFSYAISKRAMAAHIDAYVNQYDKRWCYLIPCNLYGEYDKFDENKSHFVSALIKKIHKSEKTLDLWGTGKPLRQFMYTDDLARIIDIFIRKDINENVNVAPDYVHSIDEIAKIATKACKKTHLKIRYNNDRELDGQFRKDVDSSKLMSIIDKFEFTSLEEGIEKVYDNFS